MHPAISIERLTCAEAFGFTILSAQPARDPAIRKGIREQPHLHHARENFSWNKRLILEGVVLEVKPAFLLGYPCDWLWTDIPSSCDFDIFQNARPISPWRQIVNWLLNKYFAEISWINISIAVELKVSWLQCRAERRTDTYLATWKGPE